MKNIAVHSFLSDGYRNAASELREFLKHNFVVSIVVLSQSVSGSGVLTTLVYKIRI